MSSSTLAVAESVNHFVHVEINGKKLRIRAIRKDGSLLDEFTIIKKGKGYDPTYITSVQSQKRVDLLTSLSSRINLRLNYVPFKDFTTPHTITLNSCVNEDIRFRIELNEHSTESYRMNSLEGVLTSNGKTEVLRVFILSWSSSIVAMSLSRGIPGGLWSLKKSSAYTVLSIFLFAFSTKYYHSFGRFTVWLFSH